VKLFDFAVHGVLPHDRVVLFQFHAVWCVLAVLLRDVTRSAGQASGFMFGAFKDNLDSVAFAFLCHFFENLGERVNCEVLPDYQQP
jgi:hypothetical protein